jgi:ATP-dependent DNA helicase PIF1
MKQQDEAAELLKAAKLIVWDEAPMAHKYCYGALDRLLRDILDNQLPFGGKVIVLAGDFRQVLPVVPKGSRAQIVQAAVKCHSLWSHFYTIRLTKNMRAMRLLQEIGEQAAQQQQEWADYLLQIGEHASEKMLLPSDMVVPTQGGIDQLIQDIYGDLRLDVARIPATLIHKCILAPKNDNVDQLNDRITHMFPGEEHIILSADHASDADDFLYPREFLNSLNPSGFPPHELRLKVGCPIILLRNLDFNLGRKFLNDFLNQNVTPTLSLPCLPPTSGLANGTRLILTEIKQRVLKATILTGAHAGKHVLIPRLPMASPDSANMPISFIRRQFPVRPAFAMTINKSQGQTFKKVGIYLPQPCFSHGQLYVAMSRVGERSGVRILVEQESEVAFTDNVVYEEIFIR